jgi:hypothetical protein
VYQPSDGSTSNSKDCNAAENTLPSCAETRWMEALEYKKVDLELPRLTVTTELR